jgi:hypothetical protein
MTPSITSTGLPSTVSEVILTSLNISPRRFTSRPTICRTGGLRQQPHHIDAPDHQRQHQRAHGGAGGGQADGGFARRAQARLRLQEILQPRRPGRTAPQRPPVVVAGHRRPVGLASLGRAFASQGQSPDIEGLSTSGVSCSWLRPRAPVLPIRRRRPDFRLPPSRGRRGDFDRIFRPRQPDFLAAGTAHGTAGRAQGSQINGIGRCTMGANDVHGANLHNELTSETGPIDATRRPLTNRKP